MKALALIAVTLALSSCGSRQMLKPQAGQSAPPLASAARVAPTPDQLMTADDQARPRRNDEVLKRSERRQPDKFDLPPPG